jgi:N-acetylneuraminic acid mutarotase
MYKLLKLILLLSLSYSIFFVLTSDNIISSTATATATSSSTDSFWTTGAFMPSARSEIAGVVLNGKIYVIGGFDETGKSSSSIEVYDPSINEWSNNISKVATIAPLPQPLDHTAAASYDGKMYVVGGGYPNRDDFSNKLFIYDPIDNKWIEGEDLPSPRGALTANFINGTLYVVGGVDIASGTTSSNWAYNPTNNTWIEKAHMPTAREHLTSVVINNKLYVIGGRTSGMATNVDVNEVYDPVTDKWMVLKSMPSQRGGLASAAVNGSIYVFGGEVPARTFDNNERYDIVSNEWNSELSMPTARHGLIAIAIEDIIYVIGGGPQPGGSGSNLNEIFHVKPLSK